MHNVGFAASWLKYAFLLGAPTTNRRRGYARWRFACPTETISKLNAAASGFFETPIRKYQAAVEPVDVVVLHFGDTYMHDLVPFIATWRNMGIRINCYPTEPITFTVLGVWFPLHALTNPVVDPAQSGRLSIIMADKSPK